MKSPGEERSDGMKATKRGVCCPPAAAALAASLCGCSDEAQEAAWEDRGFEEGAAASDGWSVEPIGAVHGRDRVYLLVDEETGVECIYAYDPGELSGGFSAAAVSVTPRLDADGEIYVRGAADVEEEEE